MSSSYNMDDVHAWAASNKTWPEFYSARVRRKRLIRRCWMVACVAGACLCIVLAARLMFAP